MEKGVPIRSLSRGIVVLQELNRRQSLSMTQIAQIADVPYATAMRIVQTLVFHDLVEREPGRKMYRPTARVSSLSTGLNARSQWIAEARAPMVALTLRTGWPLTLTTRVGLAMIIRECTHDIAPNTFNDYRPGYSFPLLEASSGQVCMSYMDDAERTSVIAALKGAAPTPGHELISQWETGTLVRRIRQQGYATKRKNLYTEDPGRTSSIAVPIMHDGSFVGALALTVFASSMTMTDAVDLFVAPLKAAAAQIAQGAETELGEARLNA